MKERTQIPVTPMSIPSKETNSSAERFVSLTPSGFTQLPETIFDTKTVVHPKIETRFPRNFPEDGSTARVAIPPKSNPLLRWETLLIIAILLIVGLVHGINMFHYPYYESDEGTYISQAWAVVSQGRLAYYTYWYDHAPAGWIQIALWAFLTGGFHSFGATVDSGRVLIFLMQIVATFMVYRIARSVSNNVLVAMIASLLFALSPYGLYFYRRVLLDNISMFWMLVSILLLVSGKLSLKRVWASAVALGISALSKEVTFFLIPAMAYLVFVRADRSHRLLATLGWMALVISFLSLYPLMATIKNELFPTGTLLGGTAPHVSLLGTLQYQASRGKDAGLLAFNSNFWVQTRVWMQGDPVLIVVGSFCAMLSVTLIKWQKIVGIIGLLTLSLWAFFARGGIVFNFYIVSLLPLLALSTSLLLWSIAKVVRMLFQKIVSRRKKMGLFVEQFVIVTCICLIVISCYKVTLETGKHYADPALAYQSDPYVFWDNKQSDAQNQAVSWIKSNLPLKSHMVVDESSWQDLYDDGYTNAHYYWKVENDPAIRNNVFHNNWRRVDYIVTTPQMLTDLVALPLVTTVWKHSTPIISFDTGGWTVEVRKVNK